MPRNNKLIYIPAQKHNPQRSAKAELAHAKIKPLKKIARHSRSDAPDDYLMLYIMKWWGRLTLPQRLLFLAALLVLMASGCFIIFSRSNKYANNKLPKASGFSDLYFFNASSSITKFHKSNVYNHRSPDLDKLSIDSTQNTTLKNEASTHRPVVVCDNKGVCQSESDSASKEVNSSKQVQHKEQSNSLLPADLKERIIASDYAADDYKDSDTSLSEDSNFIVKTLEHLAHKNQRMKCKLKTLLKYSSLKIIVTTREDPAIGEHADSGAQFSPESNTIRIFRDTFEDVAFSAYLFHEFHHAFVYYENRIDVYSFFKATSQSDQPEAIPCFEYGGHKVNCTRITQMLNKGYQAIDEMFKILDKRADSLNPSEANSKKLYLQAIKSYKPFKRREIIQPEKIQYLKKNGYIDESLNIITHTGSVRGTITIGPKNRDIYIYKLEKAGKDYYSTYGYSSVNEKDKAPLIDFFCFFDSYHYVQDAATKLAECDAIVNHLYEEYPVLLDLLFPGLHEYHSERAGSKYQQCIKR
jgi:hypothetical protein